MRKVLNALLFLILLGAVLFVAWKAKLIPDPFGEPGPTNPTPGVVNIVEREELRVAVAERPEKLMISSLQRLLEVENLKLELVEYNPETVWLELAGQEIDLVIVPVGEAVQGQGRFKAGRFLFFTGLSQGLDELLAVPEAAQPARVAVQRTAATDFLARQMLPDAEILPAQSLAEVESWLTGGAVEAALIDRSANAPELAKKFKSLKATSADSPMPTVAVLSRSFAENGADKAYDTRREVLFAALKSWGGLVSYLETQPELLKTTLKKEADASGVDVERLLKNYRYLAPSSGRSQLEEYQQRGLFKQTLDLLVLSGVPNLTAPDWEDTVRIPSALAQGFGDQVSSTNIETQEKTPVPKPPQPSTTPTATAETPSVTPEQPPAVSGGLTIAPTHTYALGAKLPQPWPSPALKRKHGKSLYLPPALSRSRFAALSKDYLNIYGDERKKVIKVPLASEATTPAVSDGRHFYLGLENEVLAVNSSGKTLWKKEVKGKPFSATRVQGERLLFAIDEGDRGRLICLDAVDGEQLWEAVTASPPSCRPTVGEDGSGTPLVIILEQSGQMRAWELESGSSQWEAKLDKPIYIPPAAGFGKLALTDPKGKVQLFDLSSGQKLWTSELGSSVTASPTLTASGVLVPAKDTYLYFLSLSNGALAWKTLLSATLSEPAIVVDKIVLQADETGKIHQLTADNGALIGGEQFGSKWVSQPVFENGRWAVVQASGETFLFEN